MRRFFVVFLLSLVMLTACTQKTETPEQTLEAFLSHMQKGEYAKADEYIHNPSEEKLTKDLEGFSTDSEFVRILRTYEFEIGKEIKTLGNEAIIPLKAKYPNLVPVFSDVMTRVSELIFTDPTIQKLSDEQMKEKVNTMLSETAKEMEAELEYKESEFEVKLIKEGQDWKVDIDNKELVHTLSGHLFSNKPAE